MLSVINKIALKQCDSNEYPKLTFILLNFDLPIYMYKDKSGLTLKKLLVCSLPILCELSHL